MTDHPGTPRDLVLPAASSAPEKTTVSTNGSVVIIGANGSGKTRLGVWLDLLSPQAALTHRVAAQKSLTIPENSPTSSLQLAENDLLYGYPDTRATHEHKAGQKWGGRPNTNLQNDYDRLLTFLFTDEFDKSTSYRQQAQSIEGRTQPPETKLDIIKRIWESVLPHCELLIHGGKLETRSKGSGAPYHAAEMSDGERVIFYLIGQSLAAKSDGVLIIDEPELHLHRSIQASLWDAIEAERPDCLFVYLTHDLDFAATRQNAMKIWLKSYVYANNQWDWIALPAIGAFPERLLFEVLGSRKPILFVEGERESLDSFVFSKLFSERTVVPCGPASEVMHATWSFASLRHLHSLDCAGIVDRDLRNDEQVERLHRLGVSCLDVSEIENLIIGEAALRTIAVSLHRDDVDELVANAKAEVFAQMTRDKERIISALVAARIEDGLKQFDAKAIGRGDMSKALTALTASIDVGALFDTIEALVEDIQSRQDYTGALRLYQNKGLVPAISILFGFKPHEMLNYVRRLLTSKESAPLIAALRTMTPEIAPISSDPKSA